MALRTFGNERKRAALGVFNGITTIASIVALLCPRPALAQTNLLINGDFETGDFTGWQRFVQAGSSGSFQITEGTTTPVELFPSATPASGQFYAVTDSNLPNTGDQPSTQALIQTFTLPALTQPQVGVTLQFSLFVNDWYGFGALNTAGPLDYSQGAETQYARVDLLTSSSLPFSTDEGDIVRTFYLGNDGTEPGYPFRNYTFNLAAQTVPGGTYQLRFASVNNQFSLNMGVDNVRLLVATAPEPSAFALALFAGAFIGPILNRRRSVHTP